MKKTDVIVVLSGGLICENGVWRTTRYDEKGDTFGALGDRARVEAAVLLYAEHSGAVMVVSGGKGQYKNNPNAPTLSSVLKRELIELGVPAGRIIEENASDNTWQQLQNLKMLMEREKFNSVLIVSNEWHLPRVLAMVEKDADLRRLSSAGTIRCESAEKILLARDPGAWKAVIERAYQSDGIKKRIALERKGVEEIKAGMYRLS